MSKNRTHYRVVPCTNGVCAILTRSDYDSILETSMAMTTQSTILLPGGIERDTLVPDGSYLYSDAISLTEDDLRFLNSSEESFSFTCYGPESLDKTVNEDFALSGQFLDEDNKICARFSVIADGISNGFAFPQRGAHISCFATYQCLKNSWYDRWVKHGSALNNDEVEYFREELTDNIRRLLRDDYQQLINQMVEPSHISEKVWRERFLENPERWYGNTLIVSFMSVCGGFVLFIGDGAIVLIKGDVKEAQDVLRSDDDSQLNAYITTELTSGMISGAAITASDNTDFVEIITATDGLDRTFSRADRQLPDLFEARQSIELIVDEILDLDHRYAAHLDADNYSIARVFFESQQTTHERLTNQHAMQQAFEPIIRAVEHRDSKAVLLPDDAKPTLLDNHVDIDKPEHDMASSVQSEDVVPQPLQWRKWFRFLAPVISGLLLCTMIVLLVMAGYKWLEARGSNTVTIKVDQVEYHRLEDNADEPLQDDKTQKTTASVPNEDKLKAESTSPSSAERTPDLEAPVPGESGAVTHSDTSDTKTNNDSGSVAPSEPQNSVVPDLGPAADETHPRVIDNGSVQTVIKWESQP